jgi:hypothetical protein
MAASLEGLSSMELFTYLVSWLVNIINESDVTSEVTTSINKLEIRNAAISEDRRRSFA